MLSFRSHFWTFGSCRPARAISKFQNPEIYYILYIYIFNGRFGDCAGGLTDRPKVKSETKNDLFRFTYQSLTRFWSRPKVSKITKTGWLFNSLANGIFGVFCFLWFIKGLASYPH